MYVTTPDGRNHYIFDATKDIPDLLRQYVCDDIVKYIEDVLTEQERCIALLKEEIESADRSSEMAWEEVRDMMVDIRDMADEVRAWQRVDRKKLDYKMTLIYDKINERL